MLEIEERILINMICSLVASIFGLPGNLLIMKFFANDHPSKRASTNRPYVPTANKITPYHLCILHLAFADFMTCVLSVVWSTYQYVNYAVLETRINGPIKLTFNFIYLFYIIFSMTSSGISFILSIERYFKIASPFGSIKFKKPGIHICCALFYTSNLAATFPTDFVMKNDIETELIINGVLFIFGIIMSIVIPSIGKKGL